MTKEEWKEVESQWSNPFGTIRLTVDGYEVSLHAVIYKLKLIHSVYINGWIKGEWLNENCEEGRRFYRVKESFLHSPARRKEALKSIGKRLYKEVGYDNKYRCVVPDWTSFAAFKKHLIANNKEITLVQKESLDFGQ